MARIREYLAMATYSPLSPLPNASRAATKRRTSRLAMSLKINVRGQDRTGAAFTLAAKACNLNHHGGTIAINRELRVGTTIELRNARQAEAAARIVKEVSENSGTHIYGVEFTAEASGFWGITFPSAEQTPRLKRFPNEF